MIQRKQTVYLLLTTIVSVLFLVGYYLNFISENSALIKISYMTVVSLQPDGTMTVLDKILPLTILIFLIPLVSVVSVFLYTNRHIQIIASKILIALCVLFILLSVYYSWSVVSEYKASYQPGFKSIIPFVQLILSYLAFRGIRSDDRLVKSYDRLR